MIPTSIPPSLLCCVTGASEALFDLLYSLPCQLKPHALSMVHTLDLEVFPETPSGWAALRDVPALRELLLPPFKPALPHEHLPALAQITQLTGLTASVQVRGVRLEAVAFKFSLHSASSSRLMVGVGCGLWAYQACKRCCCLVSSQPCCMGTRQLWPNACS